MSGVSRLQRPPFVAGFLLASNTRRPPQMSHDIRDWLGFAFTTAGFFISLCSLWNGFRTRRHRRRVWFRSFKGFGMEWTAYDERNDDRRS